MEGATFNSFGEARSFFANPGFAVVEFSDDIYGRKFQTRDGRMCHLRDFQINGQDWSIRNIVGTSGSWFPRNQQLVSKGYFSHLTTDGGFLGAAGSLPVIATDQADAAIPAPPRYNGNVRLLSSRELAGYRIIATDGETGTLGGMMIDLCRWEVPYLVVVTGRWYSSSQMLVDPRSVTSVSERDRSITVSLSKDSISSFSS